MYCSRDHNYPSRFNQQYEKSTQEKVLLSEDALRAFDALKQACMSVPVLAFANYTKEFLLETNASREGLGAVFSPKQVDG